MVFIFHGPVPADERRKLPRCKFLPIKPGYEVSRFGLRSEDPIFCFRRVVPSDAKELTTLREAADILVKLDTKQLPYFYSPMITFHLTGVGWRLIRQLTLSQFVKGWLIVFDCNQVVSSF